MLGSPDADNRSRQLRCFHLKETSLNILDLGTYRSVQPHLGAFVAQLCLRPVSFQMCWNYLLAPTYSCWCFWLSRSVRTRLDLASVGLGRDWADFRHMLSTVSQVIFGCSAFDRYLFLSAAFLVLKIHSYNWKGVALPLYGISDHANGLKKTHRFPNISRFPDFSAWEPVIHFIIWQECIITWRKWKQLHVLCTRGFTCYMSRGREESLVFHENVTRCEVIFVTSRCSWQPSLNLNRTL